MPTVRDFEFNSGVFYYAVPSSTTDARVDRVSTWMAPNIMSVPDVLLGGLAGPRGFPGWFRWTTPTTFSRIVMMRARTLHRRIRGSGKGWWHMTAEEHQDTPGDYEAQAGQGPISLHSEEHLGTSDRGISMQRRILERESRR